MMEYKEEDYLMLSGIQHFCFCRRQWALIHIEQQWADNVRTFEGEVMHRNAHDGCFREKRNDMFITRNLPIFSRILGTSGNCDIVEFRGADNGVEINGRNGRFIPYPIEYKRGEPKEHNADIMQLTAQAMCLEEMLNCNIEEGALYYGETRHRLVVRFTSEMRDGVMKMFNEMHKYYDDKHTPKVKWSKSCNACSLNEICMPQLGKNKDVNKYISKRLSEDDL